MRLIIEQTLGPFVLWQWRDMEEMEDTVVMMMLRVVWKLEAVILVEVMVGMGREREATQLAIGTRPFPTFVNLLGTERGQLRERHGARLGSLSVKAPKIPTRKI